MNDEAIVKVLQESREIICKCLLVLDMEQGYNPIISVQKDRLKLLRSEIDEAIRYLEDEERCIATCHACDDKLTVNSDVYCEVCREHQ